MALIETSEEMIAELQRQGWSVTHAGKKYYLVAPNGMKCPMIKTPLLKLYVLQAKRSTRFKIGISADPLRRMRDMQTGSAVRLDLVCSVGIDEETTETLSHDIMRQYHCHGEWFDLGQYAYVFRHDMARCETAEHALRVFERFGQKERIANLKSKTIRKTFSQVLGKTIEMHRINMPPRQSRGVSYGTLDRMFAEAVLPRLACWRR